MTHNFVMRLTSALLTLVIVIAPPLCDVASAQPSLVKVRGTSMLDQQHVAVTHVNVTPNSNGHAVVGAMVAYGSRSLQVEVVRNRVTFGGGYTLEMQPLARSESQIVVQMIARSPDGRVEVAVIRVDLRTMQRTAGGVDKVHALLGQSQSLDLLTAAMPMITSAARDAVKQAASRQSRVGVQEFGDPSTDGWFACTAAILAMLGSGLLVLAACGTPEPAQPLACAGAVLVFVSATMLVMEECVP